jgi:hypothetical protein
MGKSVANIGYKNKVKYTNSCRRTGRINSILIFVPSFTGIVPFYIYGVIMMELLRNESITITDTAMVISEEKDGNTGRRVDLLILNTSPAGQVISLAVDSAAENLHGIVLNVGGFYEFTVNGNTMPTQKSVTAISSVASGTIALFERVI